MSGIKSFFLEIFSYVPELLQGALVTCELTVIVMAISLFGGMFLALARISKKAYFRVPSSALIGLIRGTPLLLQLFYIYFIFPSMGLKIGAFTAGVIALSVHYSCYLSEVYRSGISAISNGQIESSLALGMNYWKTMRLVVLPQAVRIVVPTLGNYFISLIKDTALASTITVNEMMFSGDVMASTSFRYFEIYTSIGIIYFVLSYFAALLVKQIEKRVSIP